MSHNLSQNFDDVVNFSPTMVEENDFNYLFEIVTYFILLEYKTKYKSL